jgi:hypothetical protein
MVCLGGSLYCPAQKEEKKPFEAGVQFTSLSINTLEEKPPGIGGRASYEFNRKNLIFAPEVEFNYFPQNPSGNFGESQLLAGARVGFKTDRIGVFMKARPGFVHFGGDDFKSRNNGPSTNFACDLGAVFEYPTSGRVGFRFDVGDTLIQFSRPVFTGLSTVPRPPGLSHNFQSSIGVVFRF